MTILRTRVLCEKLVGTSRETCIYSRLCPCRDMISQGIAHAQNASLVSCCTRSGWMISSWEPQEGVPAMMLYLRFETCSWIDMSTLIRMASLELWPKKTPLCRSWICVSVKDGAVQFNGEPPFEKRTFDLAVQEFGNVLFVQGSPKPRSPNYSKTNVGIEKGLGERVLSVENGHESLAAARSMMDYLYRSMWYSPHDSRCSFVASKQPSLFCPLPFLNEGASQFNILQALHETWECKLLGYETNSGHMLMTLFLYGKLHMLFLKKELFHSSTIGNIAFMFQKAAAPVHAGVMACTV